MNNLSIVKKIIKFIKTPVGDRPVVLGISGGVDSAVVAYLAVLALGKNKVFGLIAPKSLKTGNEDVRLAKLVVDKLKIKYQIVELKNIVNSIKKNSGLFVDKKSFGNLQSRLRMCLLYGKANEIDGLVLGTGNKSEIMIGYFTKYGDGGTDILPIGDLYKTQVWELAKHLKVPEEIINRPPTAGLWPGQTDENELGISYEKLDKILIAIEKKKKLNEFDKKDMIKIKKYISNTEHKRILPKICYF